MKAYAPKALSPHDRRALINLEALSLTKRCVRDDRGCVFTIGVFANLLGIDGDQVRAFIDKRSENYDHGFPPPDGFFNHRGEEYPYWLARKILSYCRSLMNGVAEVKTKARSDVCRRAEKGAQP